MSCSDQYLSYSSQYPLNCSGSYPLTTELFRLIFTELFKSISELLRPVLSTKLFRLISDNPLSCSGWYLSYSGQYPLNCSGLYLLSCSGRYSQYTIIKTRAIHAGPISLALILTIIPVAGQWKAYWYYIMDNTYNWNSYSHI